jgi:site-specific DNA recombinase
MRAWGYCRVSSEGQAAEGVSLDAQRARIEAWCAARGAELMNIHVDAGISGYRKENRPGLKAALAAVCAGGRGKGRVLVVYSLSRMARSSKDSFIISEMIDKAGPTWSASPRTSTRRPPRGGCSSASWRS